MLDDQAVEPNTELLYHTGLRGVPENVGSVNNTCRGDSPVYVRVVAVSVIKVALLRLRSPTKDYQFVGSVHVYETIREYRCS